MKESCKYIWRAKKEGHAKFSFENSKSFVSSCLVLWISEKTVYICIFRFHLTWFSNLSYLASYFLRTYCTHVLMLFEGPLRGKSWLKALSSTEVGGPRARTEQLPHTHWTFVIYKLFSDIIIYSQMYICVYITFPKRQTIKLFISYHFKNENNSLNMLPWSFLICFPVWFFSLEKYL